MNIEKFENITWKEFVKQFLLRTEFIGSGIITPLIAFIGFFYLELSTEIVVNFITIVITTTLFIIFYVFLSLLYILRKIRKLFDVIFNNQKAETTQIEKIIKQFYYLPIHRSIDVFFRVIVGLIIFSLLFKIFINFELYNYIRIVNLFFLFAGLCGISYYLFLEDLILKITNTENFKNFLIKYSFEGYLKYKYTLSYLLFFFFFLMASLSGFIITLSGNYIYKNIYKENVRKDVEKVNINITNKINHWKLLFSDIEKILISNQYKANALKEIENLLNVETYIIDFALYNAEKQNIQFSLNQKISKEDIENMKDIIDLNESFVISNGRSNINGDPYKILYVVYMFNQNYKGILLINLDQLSLEILEAVNLENSSEDNMYLVVDKEEKIIMTTNPDLIFYNLNTIGGTNHLGIIFKKYNQYYDNVLYNKKIYEVYFMKNSSTEFYVANLYNKNTYQKQILLFVLFSSTFIFILGILFSLFFVYLMNRKTISLEKITNAIKEIVNGNLKSKNHLLLSFDEFGIVAKHLMNLQGKLIQTLSETKSVAILTKDKSQNFTKLTNHLVMDSENEATTTEEISASIEEISASMDKISEFTSQQNELIQSLNQSVSELSQVVKEAQGNIKEVVHVVHTSDNLTQNTKSEIESMSITMNDIKNISSQISNVVNLVKDIADQINLLSLNASIEAARAGDYGRGFAVVATEISKLAEKTMTSTKDIHSLIKNTTSQIQKSIQISEKVKEIFFQIIEHLKTISSLSTKISEVIMKQEFVNTGILTQMKSVSGKSTEVYQSIMEQKIAMKEISESVNSINKNIVQTSENARLIHEGANEISSKISELEKLLEYFKI